MKYELKKATREIAYKNRYEIKEGCTLGDDDMDIKSFDDKDKALEELMKYKSSIIKFSSPGGIYYSVEEYYVEEAEYDEDGDWIGGGDVWAFSKMEIELIEKESCKTVGIYLNMEEAERAEREYKGEDEVYLSF